MSPERLWLLVAAAAFSTALVSVEGVVLQQKFARSALGSPPSLTNVGGELAGNYSLINAAVQKRRDDFKLWARSAVNSTQVPGPTQPTQQHTRPVWLVLSTHQADYEYMFLPIIATLKEAFQVAAGISLGVVFARDEACNFERAVENSLQGGLMPVVIAMQWFLFDIPVASCTPGPYGALLSRLQTMSYLILYNDEPSERIGPGGDNLEKAALQAGASEVWSYSRYIMSVSEASLNRGNIISRPMPAGCAQALDFGVLAVPGANPRNYSKVGFLGAWKDRPIEVHQTLVSGFGDRIASENQARSIDALRSYLMHCPLVQINPHSFRNPTGQALESFRVALLVMNGACMISEPVHALDQVQFEGVLRFEPASNFKAAVAGLLNNPAGVAQCNAQSRQLFCANFAPAKLLSDSGFLHFMQTMP